MITQAQLQERLDAAAAQLHVPGAAIAVVDGDDVVTAVTGIANMRTGLPVASDTLFAVGSVTKVFTASLIMSLVDDGLLDVDAPVVQYMPALRQPDITVAMLLDHTSGLAGNFTPDIPTSREMMAQYVAAIAEEPIVSRPGALWSYTNGGLNVAGHLAEVVTGQTYDEALVTRILQPLGANASADAEELLMRSVAVGHLVDPATGAADLGPQFRFPPSHAPAGCSLWADIHTLVAFAQMHLRGGLGPNGAVLSEASVKTMATPRIETPWGMPIDQFGLGWSIRNTPAGPVVGHTGANIGSHSALSLLPDRGVAIGVMTNGTTGAALHGMLLAGLLQELYDVPPFVPAQPPAEPVEVSLDRLTGVFTADQGAASVELVDGALQVSMTYDPYLLKQFAVMGIPQGPDAMPLVPVSETRLLADVGSGMGLPGMGVYIPVEYTTDGSSAPGQTPSHLYVGRLFRRTA